MTEQCKHEWNTRYTKRFYGDGVEWFCVECGANLDWPTVKKRVNEYPTLKAATEELIEVASLRGDNELPHPSDDPALWTARMQQAWDILANILDAS